MKNNKNRQSANSSKKSNYQGENLSWL